MIDAGALAALPPARRAQLIYSEAQAELSKRLWQAALGSEDRSGRADAASLFAQPAMALDTLVAAPSCGCGAPSAGSIPTIQPAVLYTERAITQRPADEPAMGSTIDGLGANARYRPALEAAGARTGLPAAAIAAIVDAEAGKAGDGSWHVFSRNPRSSAAGLGQFLSRTWEGLAETNGTWLNGLARTHGWLDANGAVIGTARGALLATRYDPTAAINSVADYARRNLDGLSRAGVSVDGDISATARLAYLGHHLGLGDAVQFLRVGGLDEGRARKLLGAQIGSGDSARRIAASSSATAAHREWLSGYIGRKVRVDRFTAAAAL